MKDSKLFPVTYYDSSAQVRLQNYADTIVMDDAGEGGKTLCAIRFGGYPEQVRGMADAIYGGGDVEVTVGGTAYQMKSLKKQYHRQVTHDGVYAEATLIAEPTTEDTLSDQSDGQETMEQLPPRSVYIFCKPGDRDALFHEVDRITAVPLIPAFRDYVLVELKDRGILQNLGVLSASKQFDAWVLRLTNGDANIVSVVEDGLRSGALSVPGGKHGPSPFGTVGTVTDYLNSFGTVLAERIKKMFVPLFDPAAEPLSPEVLAINSYIHQKAGYELYNAQLAVAEAIKRQLTRSKAGIVVAECGSWKTKIGATAFGALWGLSVNRTAHGAHKTFNIVLCPSHMTKKWVREIEETLPNTFAVGVKSITDFDRIYGIYAQGSKSCYVVISKEKARDGYMRAPAVKWNRRKRGFLCPDCGAVIQMDISEDGAKYTVNADQFFFKKEHGDNHKCEECGSSLWTALNPYAQDGEWVKIGGYGFVHRRQAIFHLEQTKNAAVCEKIEEIAENPNGRYPAVGAHRSYPLSTFIKKRYRGRIDGLLVDELHQYSQNSGQGDAMGELFGVAKKVVGLTGTLINGYSSGLFYLLYRIAAPLMQQDGKEFSKPAKFNEEYGVIQNVYETKAGDYNSNRRTVKSKKLTKQLPGVSPLVYSRFLLENATFLSLSDMGKELPDYEEIPVPLDAPEAVMKAYERMEDTLKKFLKEDRKAAQKLLSAYLNLLTAYPDQPYGHDPIVHPLSGKPIVVPPDITDFDTLSPKDDRVMELVSRKVAMGEKVIIYTNWTRLDTQRRLQKLLTEAGCRTAILQPTVSPSKREEWVDAQLSKGLQILITNPSLVETGLDLNAFTTLIFYDTGFKLFTLRQASRRSWRINQTAPRIEVYMLYYVRTMQHKAMKLMANKLAVAGIIEGGFSEEGLAAMSECEDMTTAMAKELMLGIQDSVEDVAAAFKKMAIIRPVPTERGDAIIVVKGKKQIVNVEGQLSLFGALTA